MRSAARNGSIIDLGPRARVVVMKAGRPKAQSVQLEDPFQEMVTNGLAIEPPVAPEKLLALAEENAIHAAAIGAKVVDSVGHGWKLNSLNGQDADEDKLQKQNEALDTFLAEVSGEYTFGELLEQARWEAEAVGWSAWEVAREGETMDGRIIGIFPLPVHTLRAVRRRDRKDSQWVQIIGTEVRHWVSFGSGLYVDKNFGADTDKESKFLAREIVVFKPYCYADRRYAVPKWNAAASTIAELSAIREFNISYFDSAGLADMLLHVTGGSADEAGRVATDIEEKMKQTRGQAHVMVITFGSEKTKVESVELGKQASGQRDREFRGGRDDLMKEVLIAHNVPPYRVGWAEVGNLGGSPARETLRAYRYGSIEPWQERIEDRLAKTIFGPRGYDLKKMGSRWELENLDWEQIETDMALAYDGVRVGVFTPNEAREKLGASRKDDPLLDKHYMAGIEVGSQPQFPPATFGPAEEAPPDDAAPDEPAEEPGSEPPYIPKGVQPPPAEDLEKLEKARRERFTKIDGRRTGWVTPRRRIVASIFEAERDEVLRAIKASDAGTAQRVAEDALKSEGLRSRWLTWMRETYLEVGSDLAEEAIEDIARNAPARKTKAGKKPPKEEPKPSGPKITPRLSRDVVNFLGGPKKGQKVVDLWARKVGKFLRQESSKKVVQVTETTRQSIRDEIGKGLKAEEGIDSLAKRIDKLYLEQIIPNRSEVIARTEVISAANLGSTEIARSMTEAVGLTIKKRWLSTKDSRTREDHTDVDGQVVGMDDAFEVAGEKLMYPGDSSLGASPWNTIQCRCTVTFEPVTEQESGGKE